MIENRNKNHFKLFDIDQKFDLDLKELKTKYLSLQIKYHPDTAKDELEKRQKLEMSMLLNEAYKILYDDYSRAEYLLGILGKLDKSAKLNQDELESFLREFEEVEELDHDELVQKQQAKISEKKHMIAEIANSFSGEDFPKAQNLTVKLKYLMNLISNIKTKIDNANN